MYNTLQTTPRKLQHLIIQHEYSRVNNTSTMYMYIHRFAPGFVNYKKGVLDSQPQVIKLTSCLPMVGGSLRVLRLLPPLKLVIMI
jgi:hypothetical protein